mgnify:CR=1 FL=1
MIIKSYPLIDGGTSSIFVSNNVNSFVFTASYPQVA